MEEQYTRNSHHLPVYNIKAVARLLGLLPVTLRAWERRYGLPSPQRGDQGYRLYSEYDLHTLRWLKNQVDAGMSIGRAVEYLHELRSSGRDPAEEVFVAHPESEPRTPVEALTQQFRTALIRFDGTSASEAMRQAFVLYSVDLVLSEVVQPTLVELGEAWHRGEIPIAVEHFATQYCISHLMGMLAGAMPLLHHEVIVAACAPGEMHEIGLLMLVVMLRWRGWDVKYLGPNLSLEHLEDALGPLHPRALLISATRSEAAGELEGLKDVLARFPRPQPLVILGGQAFESQRLPDDIPALYLSGTPGKMVHSIEMVVSGSLKVDVPGAMKN